MNEPVVSAGLPAVASGRIGLKLTLVSLAIALAAVNTGNNLLYLILSLVLALASISAVAASWSLRHLSVIPVLPAEITSGEPFLAGAEVRGRFPLLPQTWVRVTISGLPVSLEIDVPVAGDTGRGIASAHVTAPSRGSYDNLAVVVSTGYPLGLAVRHTRATRLSEPLIVLPRFDKATSLRVPDSGGARPGPAATSRDSSRAGVDLHKIREYTGQEDARRIDWRSSARTRRLMLKEFDREHERRIDLVLDLHAGSDAAFESAVERCAAILDLAHRNHYDARLMAGIDMPPVSGRAALRHLAAVRRLAGPGSQESVSDLTRQTRGEAELIVVSADPERATPIVLV